MNVWNVYYSITQPNVNGEMLTSFKETCVVSNSPENIQRAINKETTGKVIIQDYKQITSKIYVIDDDVLQQILYKKYPKLREIQNEKDTIKAEEEIQQNDGMVPRFWNWHNSTMKT